MLILSDTGPPSLMADSTTPTGEPVSFVIDGWPFQTLELRQTAAAILRLATLTPPCPTWRSSKGGARSR